MDKDCGRAAPLCSKAPSASLTQMLSVRDILEDPLKFLAAHEVIAISCASAVPFSSPF